MDVLKIIRAYSKFTMDRSVYCSPRTLETYAGHMELFFRYLEQHFRTDRESLDFGSVPPEENILSGYIIHLRRQPHPVRNTTIRSYCRSVKSFLKFCYENDYCRDYLKGVRLPRDDAPPKLPLYQDEAARLDSVMDRGTVLGLRNYCMVHLMLDCGLRTQEVIHLQSHEILRERNVIQIMDSKGCKSRMTLIPGFLADAIDSYMAMCGRTGGIIFLSARQPQPLTGNCIKMMFQDLKQRADIPRLHAHLLRHTFATSYLVGGGNLEFLRVFMGHCDYTVTQGYSRLAAQCRMLGADIYRLDPVFFTRGY